jgi:hypothetical protein
VEQTNILPRNNANRLSGQDSFWVNLYGSNSELCFKIVPRGTKRVKGGFFGNRAVAIGHHTERSQDDPDG